MRIRFSCFIAILALSLSSPASAQDTGQRSAPAPVTKVPAGVILVKGAWSSASDLVTPLPEGGTVAHDVFSDPYFGMTLPLPQGWTEKYKGPPPSDSGRYVLAQLSPSDTFQGPARGSILITAQDMFFTPLPAGNATQWIGYAKDHLQADYRVEKPPTQVKIADRSFAFFAYWSPVAQLHWYVLATEIRCHTVEIVLTSQDAELLDVLMRGLNRMKLPAAASPTGGTGGTDVPVCIQDYARAENLVARVDPVLTEHRFNPMPVRVIVDRQGNVKHIHFLSAFPGQAKAIEDALGQWKFRPYLRDGQPVEVETGILFGRASHSGAP